MAAKSVVKKKLPQSASEGTDVDPEEVMRVLEKQMMDSLYTSNPKAELEKLIQKASIIEDLFDLHFRDHHGYTLLGNAVRLGQVEVVHFLVGERNFKVKEELTIAVEVDSKECVDYFIKHKPELVGRKVLAGTVCRPGTSPVMMASLMENESMLKFLFARGAKPLELPEYDPRDMNNIIRFDAIYQTLLALSKPMYLCIMNEDPVMVAFKIAEKCQEIASILDVAKDDLLKIKDNCELFAADFIKYTENFDELELVLSQMTTEEEQLVVPGYLFERLKYAMTHDHIDYVANGSVQKLLKKKFYDGPLNLVDFERSNVAQNVFYVLLLMCLTPVWLFLYLIFPASDSPTGKFVKSWMEMPFMRFMVQATIYLVVCFMVTSSSIQTDIFFLDKYAEVASKRNCLQRIVVFNDSRCLNDFSDFSPEQKEDFKNPELFFAYLWDQGSEVNKETYTNNSMHYITDSITLFWTFGNLYKEMLTIWSDGFLDYSSDWVNMLNILLNMCFISGLSLKYSFTLVHGYKPLELFAGEIDHPLQISSTLRALGLLFLFFKLYQFLRVTQVVGRQQVLLADAFQVSFRFFLLFLVIALSFSVASNGIIWRTYKAYIRNCQKFPNGTYNPVELVTIPCPTNLAPGSLKELVRYQDILEVFATFFFGMFDGSAYILGIFPSYENAQEWSLALLYSAYVFFTVIIRLNIITSLVIAAVIFSSQTENKQFKFRRAVLMFQFIHGKDPLPPPFNIVPSIYRITAWSKERREPKYKMLSEEELLKVPTIRSLIKSLKLSYLREAKLSKGRQDLKAKTVKQLGGIIQEKLNLANSGVSSIYNRTDDLIHKKAASKPNVLNRVNNNSAYEVNQFTKKFELRNLRNVRKPNAEDIKPKFQLFK